MSQKLVDEIKNKEEVRIYRLHLLEENQFKILNKIEELEKNLNKNYSERINELEKKVKLLETGFSNIEKFKWIVIIETVGIAGMILKAAIGV